MKSKLVQKLIATGNSLAFLPLRLVLGVTLAAHGAQKLFGWFEGSGLAATGSFFQENLGLVPGVLWAFNAGAGQFVGGILLAVGFLTRIGAGLNVITMGVAVGLVHRHAFFASDNGMEFPLILMAASLTLLISGGGAVSIDRMLVAKK
jgi:putative oxidoreductase